MIIIRHSGNFSNTERFLKKASSLSYLQLLDKYGRAGVAALASATPIDSGLTADSWSYEIISSRNSYQIIWKNSNVVNGVAIAILLQYGHGTRNGGFVQGRDYINPAMKPIFDKLAEEAWREVSTL